MVVDLEPSSVVQNSIVSIRGWTTVYMAAKIFKENNAFFSFAVKKKSVSVGAITPSDRKIQEGTEIERER